MPDEVWRLVPSVPGIMASSLGRVMIMPTVGGLPNVGSRHYESYPRRGAWDGKRFILQWGKRQKTYKVARLVCEAFNGPSPFPRAVAMHKDEDSTNNLPKNLVWGTQKENLNAPGFIDYCKRRTGKNSPSVKGRKAKKRK